MSTGKKITLKSLDEETFEVDEAVALESQTIKHMIEVIEDDCADNCIPLPNVTSKILSKVIEYCKKHVDTSKSDDRPSSVDDELKAWDAEFVKVDQATLFDLILQPLLIVNYIRAPVPLPQIVLSLLTTSTAYNNGVRTLNFPLVQVIDPNTSSRDGLHVGFWDLTAAAIPETCGHAMEVPESTLNSGGSFPLTVSCVSLPIHAAIMSTPGAAISGCKARKNRATIYLCLSLWYLQRNYRPECKRIVGIRDFALRMFLVMEEGPLAEKYATAGAGLYFVTAVVGKIVATGFLWKFSNLSTINCLKHLNEFLFTAADL
ncbi:hypothetical protein GH714_006773 [Hevea brasiliensis]|uniref:SKP1 component POZ domain-containing protein n=1 Tax=Hevea brasiliensis TaxID=3981 RepID=A0A6A6L950_HEVBR|nr:hypothetical protein GH714_006773 [Hevea brasiliensis]